MRLLILQNSYIDLMILNLGVHFLNGFEVKHDPDQGSCKEKSQTSKGVFEKGGKVKKGACVSSHFCESIHAQKTVREKVPSNSACCAEVLIVQRAGSLQVLVGSITWGEIFVRVNLLCKFVVRFKTVNVFDYSINSLSVLLRLLFKRHNYYIRVQ